MGYAGGRKDHPTYRSLGDHTETFQVDFDPATISYEELLGIFWSSHNPCSSPFSRQYMSAVFYAGEEQHRLALRTKAAAEREHGRPVETAILPLDHFWLAEDYHQKHRLRRHRGLAAEYEAIYPNFADFVDSTATTRLNAWLGGHFTEAEVLKDIDRLGLTARGRKELLAQLGIRGS